MSDSPETFSVLLDDPALATNRSVADAVAGALGKPVDMIYPNEIALLWYWFHDRVDSPWYPSMTIHRPPPGDDHQALMTALARRLGEKT